MSSKTDLTLVLPVYNEAESIEPVVLEWLKVLRDNKLSFEILICEDGSTDGTKDVINKLAKQNSEVTLDSVDYRRGYGKAVIAGYTNAQGSYVLVSDSDGQINPAGFKKLWDKREVADVIIGARTPRRDPLARKLYSFLFRTYFKTLFKCELKDPSCPFVLIKAEKARKLRNLLGFMLEGFWWGFVAASTKLKYTFCEIEIEHRVRFAGDTRVYKLSKMPKIIMRNGLGLLKLRLSANY